MTRGIGTWVRGLLFAVVAVSASPLQADVLFAARTDRLYRIDTDTVTAEEIGSTGLGTIAGLAFCANGTLYGITANAGLLVTIDPETAAGEILGVLDVPISSNSGLACDPTTDMLYAISSQGAGAASFLVSVSPETAFTTPIADTDGKAILGLGCDASGQLFGLDGAVGKEELVLIDKETGDLAPVLAGGLAAFKSTGSLEVAPNGRVWTVNSLGGSYELVEIDPLDGFPTSLGLIQGLHGSGAINGLAGAPLAGLQVHPPSPGKACAVNIVMVTGVTPGEKVSLVYGFYAGASHVRKCSVEIEIMRPFHLRTQKASDEGVAVFRVPVRPGLKGVPILMQAVEFSSCAVSPVLTVTF